MEWPIGFSGFGISLIRSSGFGIWKQIRNWKYGREARSRVIGSCGRWNTKNNPRDNGIVQNCVGIAELKPQSNLSKTHRYCCRALVHFHFLAFSSIFPLNWIAKQSFFCFFFSKPVFNTRRAGWRYSRAADLWPLSRSWPTWKSEGCLSLMPDSSDPYR